MIALVALLAAEPACAPSVELVGLAVVVEPLRAALEARGLHAPAPGCPALRVHVSLDGRELALELGRGAARVERRASEATIAAVLVEAWVRRDVLGGIFAPPPKLELARDAQEGPPTKPTAAERVRPARAVAGIDAEARPTRQRPTTMGSSARAEAPASTLGEASASSASVALGEAPASSATAASGATPASRVDSEAASEPTRGAEADGATPPIPSAPPARPEPVPATTSLASREGEPAAGARAAAAPLARPEPRAATLSVADEPPARDPSPREELALGDEPRGLLAEPSAWTVVGAGELGLDETGSAWFGGRARVAREVGPLRLGASARGAVSESAVAPADRAVAELLFGARFPLAIGAMSLEPSLSVGPHLAVASRGEGARGPLVRDGLRVVDVTPAAEAALSASLPLTAELAFELEASLTLTPFASGSDRPPYATRLTEAQAAELSLPDHPDLVARIALGARWGAR